MSPDDLKAAAQLPSLPTLTAARNDLAAVRAALTSEAQALSRRLIEEKGRIVEEQRLAHELGKRPKRYPYAPLLLSVTTEPYLRIRWHRIFKREDARFSRYLALNRATHTTHRSALRKFGTPEELPILEEVEDAARVIRRASGDLAKAVRALDALDGDLRALGELTRPFS